jgi:hypothetical protein
MAMFGVTMAGSLEFTPDYEGEVIDHDAAVEQIFDDTMKALLASDRVIDPMVAGTIASGIMRVSVQVEADTAGKALSFAEPAIRAALHGANVGTADWDQLTPMNLRVTDYRVEPDEDQLTTISV